MNFITDYTLIKTSNRDEYFVGKNTGAGFLGTYGQIIRESELDRLFIIKGAAGTGKSTLMKRCAKSAEGSGHRVSYYRCSSDPDSLDCIITDNKLAILDGTSPHTLDMKYAGAISSIIDLTRYFDTRKLVDRRDEIINLSESKKNAYDTAYSLLGEIARLYRDRYKLIASAVDYQKLSAFADRFTKSLGKGRASGQCDEVVLRSVGMKGCFRLDTLLKKAQNILVISDVYSSSYVLMDILAEKLRKNSFDTVISTDTVTPELICDLYIPQADTLITVEHTDASQKIVNMARFVQQHKLSDIRGTMRTSLKCTTELMKEACNVLSKAGKAHFELEKIYSSAMDFDKAEKEIRLF